MAITAYDLGCLYSTVKNISGGVKRFGFLPPHGKELKVNEEYTVFGNILDAVANGFDRATSQRSIKAFENAVDDRKLEITATPSPILKDSVLTNRSFMLTVASEVLAVDDPCWESVSA